MELIAFDYVVGVTVEGDVALPEDFVTVDVPGDTDACFETTIANFARGHEVVRNEWLPGSGHARGPGPEFEGYRTDFDSADPASTNEDYVPASTYADYVPVSTVG